MANKITCSGGPTFESVSGAEEAAEDVRDDLDPVDTSDDTNDDVEVVTDDRTYDEWTNEELRDELKNRELPTTGKKDELVARLVEDDEAEEE